MGNSFGTTENEKKSGSGFDTYTNTDFNIKIQHPKNWDEVEQDLPQYSIVEFRAPDTKDTVQPAGLLVAEIKVSDGSTLDEFVDFFFKDRYISPTDYKLISSSESTLGGMNAKQFILYDYDKSLIPGLSGTTLKVMRVLAVDNKTGTGYSMKYWSQPGLFDKYLNTAQEIIDSFEVIDTSTQNEQLSTETDTQYVVTDPFDSKDKKAASSLTFNLFDKIGTRGTDEGQFISPTSIDIDNKEKTLYITDLDNNRVQKFSLDGEFITEWGSLGTSDGQFNDPGDIAVDSTEGIVYVTDINNNRIQKFDTEGKFLGKWGTTGTAEGQFDHPGDISVDQTGHFVYVTDIDNARVQKFDSNGTFITEWGSLGQGDGEFNSPAGLTISPDGETVYVSDTINNRIQMFDREGNFLGKWGILGDGIGQLNRPDGITTDLEGRIVYVADRQNERIQMFDSEGEYLTQIESLGSLAGQFGNPRDVAVDYLNRIYIVDKDNNNVQIFGPEKGSESVSSVSNNDEREEKNPNSSGSTGNTDEPGNDNEKQPQAFSSDPTSPTRHGKSYFNEVFESETDDPVFVVSHSTKKDKIFDDTTYEMVGEIKNNSDEEVTFVQIIATFYDENGIVIGTDYTYTDPTDLNPGRTAPYTLSVGFGDSIDVNDIAEAKYHLEWD